MPLTSRLYESEDDQSMPHSWRRARRQGIAPAHAGELFSIFMVACHLNPQEHIRLWHDDAGKLVGYAMLGEDPAFNWQILPAYEWSGIEDAAWDWVETRLADLRQRDAKLWGGHLVSGARQDNAKRIAFLEQHGFRYCGDFAEVNMLRSLDEPIPEAALPTGCRICSMAEISDISDRAAAHRDVWQPWTVGDVSDENYADFMRLPGYHRDLDIVAVAPDGVIAAYVNGWIDPVNRIGDFGPVGARLAYRRQGYARCARRSAPDEGTCGMNRVCVSTGISNTPARNLYESVGFRVVNQYFDYVRTE